MSDLEMKDLLEKLTRERQTVNEMSKRLSGVDRMQRYMVKTLSELAATLSNPNHFIYDGKQPVDDVVNRPNPALDNDGDDINDNPWQMLYPWDDWDFIIIEPYGWYKDGDAWPIDMSEIGALDDDSSDDSKAEEPEPESKSKKHCRGDQWAHLNRQRGHRQGR